VALLIETSNAYARSLLQGIIGYVREHATWSLHLMEQTRGGKPPPWLADWEGDGIIARIESPRIAQAVRLAGLPTVNLSAGFFAPDLPCLETDDVQIARLAADHLLGRGVRRFGYCGDAHFAWSRQRGEAFRDLIKQAGFSCDEFTVSKFRGNLSRQIAELGRWLQRLPKPAGVFACYDIVGQQVLDACRRAGLVVPEEIAVIGVDNDQLICELSRPQLSSIILNAHRTGHEAAALLDRMMRGESVPPLYQLVPPVGVKQRQSTNILTTEDPVVARALRFIREHACHPINVSDVVRAVPLSRSVLEKRFLRQLNRTPHDEILNVRLGIVRQLLSETKLSLEAIAVRTGFEHPEYLSVVFKRETGLCPRDFRKRSPG